MTDFTALSTKNVDRTQFGTYVRHSTRMTGDDSTPIILFIPIGTPDLKEAIDRTIESVPGGVALGNGVVYTRTWWIPFIFGMSSYRVEGDVLVDPGLTPPR